MEYADVRAYAHRHFQGISNAAARGRATASLPLMMGAERFRLDFRRRRWYDDMTRRFLMASTCVSMPLWHSQHLRRCHESAADDDAMSRRSPISLSRRMHAGQKRHAASRALRLFLPHRISSLYISRQSAIFILLSLLTSRYH